MSLLGDPPVIFLDEPTTGLDPQARAEVWTAVEELAAQGTTVLLTTQYLDEAERLADRIAILHEGRIIADGTLAELTALLPPVTVEYVEKQPTLEEVFLAVIGAATRRDRHEHARARRHRAADGQVAAHIARSPDDHHHDAHADRLHAVVRLRARRAIDAGPIRTSPTCCSGILLITVA
jgi:ABC-type multidrug transport system ATPase subunit